MREVAAEAKRSDQAEKQRLKLLSEQYLNKKQQEREQNRIELEKQKQQEKQNKIDQANKLLAEKNKLKADFEAELSSYTQRCQARLDLKNSYVNTWIK